MGIESEKWGKLEVLGMESENFWIFGSFRNGILFFLGTNRTNRTNRTCRTGQTTNS